MESSTTQEESSVMTATLSLSTAAPTAHAMWVRQWKSIFYSFRKSLLLSNSVCQLICPIFVSALRWRSHQQQQHRAVRRRQHQEFWRMHQLHCWCESYHRCSISWICFEFQIFFFLLLYIFQFCGDGIINNNGTETCDDANQIPKDGCTNCKRDVRHLDWTLNQKLVFVSIINFLCVCVCVCVCVFVFLNISSHLLPSFWSFLALRRRHYQQQWHWAMWRWKSHQLWWLHQLHTWCEWKY